MLTHINPKNNQQLTTSLTEEQAIAICRSLTDNSFAQSLVNQQHRLSQTQLYWLYKIAEENKPVSSESLQLKSDLEEFCSKADLLQFEWDKDRVSISNNKVYCNKTCVGELKADKFVYRSNCSEKIRAQIFVMSCSPLDFLQVCGKQTGRCCVCGITLTNPESVALGIGPICRAKWG